MTCGSADRTQASLASGVDIVEWIYLRYAGICLKIGLTGHELRESLL